MSISETEKKKRNSRENTLPVKLKMTNATTKLYNLK